jgi:hypothetical protein
MSDPFKYDPNRYAGMSLEEAREAEAADRARAEADDPRTIAVVRAAERREAERQAEQRRRIEEDRQRQGSSPAS